MKSNAIRLLAVVVLGIAVAACRAAPVYNVVESPLMASKVVTMEDVDKAVIRAGAGLGWQIVKKEEGHMVGTLILRTHRAVVDINYDTENFSISYKDSVDLKYNGSTIHSNYNGWVQNLENAIRMQAMTL